jgi:prepilin peptidase CpaA
LTYSLLAILVMTAFYTDVKETRIPNRLTMTFIMLGLSYYFIVDQWQGILYSLVGLGTGIGVLLMLYIFKALGAGDVKLFGAVGACMGLEFTLYSVMYSIIYAGLIGIVILLFRKEFTQRMIDLLRYFLGIVISRDLASLTFKPQKDTLTFPFMYAVLPGVLTASVYDLF